MRVGHAVLPISLWTLVTARLHNSLVPEDPYAFPKYRVAFLNGLPVLNDTAQRWLQNGIPGGEAEFLEQPLNESTPWSTQAVKSIDGEQRPEGTEPQPELPEYKLELMKLGPKNSFLCMIPPPPVENTSIPLDDSSTDITPARTWSLLQPLSGTCLYVRRPSLSVKRNFLMHVCTQHRQGWFTYAYCHNSHVRQFHELSKPQSQRPGEYKPEEDTEWEAYTLGRAPPTPEPGAELTVAQEAAIAANVELARTAGSRYLVQRWGEGTYCEKIGRKREIEIQFHCSMTMTDTILFVKETQTCHYVLHIATPRLCGEPGFRSRADTREEAFIRCREVLGPDDYALADHALPAADQPFRLPRRAPKPVIAPPPADDAAAFTASDGKPDTLSGEFLRAAVEKLIDSGAFKAAEVLVEEGAADGEFVIEFIDVLDGEEFADARARAHAQTIDIDEILRLLNGKDAKKAAAKDHADAVGQDEAGEESVGVDEQDEADEGSEQFKSKDTMEKSTRDEL
ncbi:hypothetical protein EIP86_004295 [Pleurotus ostreatoroseus]|nr:hypothetical protein EIP86_004295 [Pleurotus ostreatoroseus]